MKILIFNKKILIFEKNRKWITYYLISRDLFFDKGDCFWFYAII